MTTTQLAFIEIAVGVICCTVSFLAGRRLLEPAPTLGRSLATVIVWTGLAGSLPYLIFVASHRWIEPSGMGWFAAIVLGSLPLWMLISPFIGLYMVLRRLSRFVAERGPTHTVGP